MAAALVSNFVDRLSMIGGEIGRRIKSRNWSTSPLGPPETWPQTLRSLVELLLCSKFPMFVAWGDDLGLLYNDAYAEMLGRKHPNALGARFFDVWAEIWPDVSPLIDAALAGEATYREDLPLIVNRGGYREHAWFTFSYSPVRDESGHVAGMFCAVAETTGKVLAEQRQKFVVALGDTLGDLSDPVALTTAAAMLLGQHLDVGRAGYGEVDASGEIISVERDWTDGSTPSLAGQARLLNTFGPEVIAELHAGRTLVVKDCQTDPRTSRPDYLLTWESIGTRALIVVPLANEGRLVAILFVHSAAPRAWSELEARLVEDVGGRTRAALERARAEAAMRESEAALAAEVAALARLQEVSTRLVGSEAPEAIYDAILTAATELMGSECASIQMLDAVGDLQLLAHRGYDSWSVDYWQTVSASSGSTCGIALKTAERVIVSDVENSGLAPDGGDLQSYRWTGMRAVQTTPLLSRSGKPIGMISTHWKHPHTPSERDLKLFDVLARQAADAIERTMAQAALRDSEARQAFLLSLADTLRSLHTPGEIAMAAAERLGARFDLNRVFYAELSGSMMKVERDYTRGVETIVGEHDLTAFGPDLLSTYHECPVIKVDNVATDARFSKEARAGLQARQVGAFLDVILFEESRQVSMLAYQSATPRIWTSAEEALFREAAERVKVAIERARAEERLRELNDTLERRVAEALAERNMLLKLVEMADVMIMAIDLDYNILALNAANADEFERIYGVRPKVGDNMLGLLATQPEHREQVRISWAQGMRGENVTFVEDYGDPDRVRPYYEVNFRPLKNEAGEQIGVYQFVIDVTERVLGQAQLAEALAERRVFADFVESTKVAILACDLSFEVLAANPSMVVEFERVYGKPLRVGDNLLELLAEMPEQRAQVESYWGRALAGEEFVIIDEFGDEQRSHFEVRFHTLRDGDGRKVGAFQAAFDITERMRAAAELATAQDALRQSQKMEAMGQLTGGVAHDFNNLLTPIVGSLDMLQRRKLGSEREQRLIAGAMQSAERAKTLVQRLLAFARRQPLQPVPVDVPKLVSGMGDLIASTMGPQIKVVVEASDGLPPAKADPNQLEMALLNLAVNARDAMSDDGGTLHISTRTEGVRKGHRTQLRPGTYLCLSVADTGVGMDDVTIARAIEPFFSTKGVGKGTGLGLSMVHGLASQLGGALTIQSHPGLGTNVELWLPCSDGGQESVRQAVGPSDLPASRGTVLLVDDEEVVRMSTAEMLIELGYVVIEAATGEEALGLIKKGERFDILATDHLMPGLSGEGLAREVRALKPGVPTLLVSGYAERAGVDPELPRLTKPFRKDELVSSLAQFVLSP